MAAHSAFGQDYGQLVQDCASADPRVAINACSGIINSSDLLTADSFKAYYLRAKAYLALYQFDLAIADATSAIAINPANGEDYELRARAYMGEEKFSQALADANKAVSIFLDDASSLDLLVATEVAVGLDKKAVSDANKAIALSPEDAVAYCERALADEELGEPSKELDDLTTVVNDVRHFALPRFARNGEGS